MRILPVFNINRTLKTSAIRPINNSIKKDAFYSSNNVQRYSPNYLNINFTRKKKAVYAINLNGEYEKFSSQTEAAKKLGLLPENINQILNDSKHKTINGYTFADPQDVEKQDSKGGITVDEEAIGQILLNAKTNNTARPVYAVDLQGNYRKYDSIFEACRDTDISPNRASVAIRKGIIAKEHLYVYAKTVEKTDEQGNVVLDKNKLYEILENSIEKTPKNAVYVVNSTGQFKRYFNLSNASEAINIPYAKTRKIMDGGVGTIGNYIIITAKQVETKDENGKVTVDRTKMNEIIESVKFDDNKRAVYTVDINGNYVKYKNKADAIRSTGVTRHILKQATNQTNSRYSYLFIPANEVETVDENGRTVVDKKKIFLIYHESNLSKKRKSIYVIDTKTGICAMFESREDAVKKLGIKNIRTNGSLPESETNNRYLFVSANDLETIDKEGNKTIREELIQKLILTHKK